MYILKPTWAISAFTRALRDSRIVNKIDEHSVLTLQGPFRACNERPDFGAGSRRRGMRKIIAVALPLLLLAVPSIVPAKGKTTKIVIEGPDLSKPIEITDPDVLARFNVWAGPGTSSTRPGANADSPTFIVDWGRGPTRHPPEALQKYQVTFYTERQSERPSYVVYYVVAPGSKQGYVYLPGPSDKWWQLNTFSIFRGNEGQWFPALDGWENVARPLIEKAKTVAKS